MAGKNDVRARQLPVRSCQFIRAILAGERDPLVLARLRDPRCRNNESTIARSRHGNFRPEHLFSLKQAVDLYDYLSGANR